MDVRALANRVLEIADHEGHSVTNMALNKIVFFVHSDFLIEKDEPLVRAKIEAWQHGPVFREIYHEFKRWSDQPIKGRATKIDPETGAKLEARGFDGADGEYVDSLIRRYVHFGAAYLRALSHRPGSPWAAVWDHEGRSNPGMAISDALIRETYTPKDFQ